MNFDQDLQSIQEMRDAVRRAKITGSRRYGGQ